jgi:hypothetical protein
MRRWTLGLAGVVLMACGGGGGGRGNVGGPPPEWMDQKVEEQARTADPAAQREGDIMHAVAYGKASPAEWLVHLDNNHCYWFSGVGSEGVDKLSLYLWDPGHSRVDSERAAGPTVLLKYCPTQAGPYRMQGKSGKGKGFMAFGVYAVAPQVVTAPAAPVAVDLAPLVDQQAASAAPGATRAGDYFTGVGDKSEWTVAIPANTCFWMIGVGEPGKVKALQVYIWDQRGKRVTESHNDNNIAVAGTCSSAPQMYKFQEKVQSGSGAVKAAVFTKAQ